MVEFRSYLAPFSFIFEAAIDFVVLCGIVCLIMLDRNVMTVLCCAIRKFCNFYLKKKKKLCEKRSSW